MANGRRFDDVLILPPSDPFPTRWARRSVSIPLYTALFILVVGALPALVSLALLVDLARRRAWVLTRCILFFAWYLACEVAGVLASGVLWLATGPWRGNDPARFLAANYALQRWWAWALFRGGQACFGLTLEAVDAGAATRGPYILFLRHASVVDTILPVVLLSRGYGLRFRYVMKRELLWDPCLDIVGNRLPNCFVRRGSGQGEREIALVQSLLHDLGPSDAVLIYPEGTRFTPEKRAQVLERLGKTEDARIVAWARELGHVLPPRPGGPLGLLDANPGVDVVVCAHTGLEGARSFREFVEGALVGARIRLAFWRIPVAAIPAGREDRIGWLYAQWKRVDDWIAGERRSHAA